MARTDRAILADLVKHIKDEDDPLTPLVDKYLMVRDLPRYKRKRIAEVTLPMIPRDRNPGRLSPSNMCGCERQAALTFLGMDGRQTKDPKSELIFDDGNWRHHKWQYTFRDMEALFPRRIRVLGIEKPIRIDYMFTAGHFDADIELFRNKKWTRYVVDFKGANGWAWNYVFKEHKPKEEHVLQLLCYMKARGAQYGLLVYDHKESNDFVVFVVEMKRSDWRKVERWAERVLDQMSKRQLPPMHPDCHHGNFLYGRCPFKGFCFGKMPPTDVEAMAYEDFRSVKRLWLDNLLELGQDG